MDTGFVYSRTIVRIQSVRTNNKTGATSQEDRYYLSSQSRNVRTPEQWIDLIRAHWAGVENRNHWRRDATLGEDALRLKHPRAVANLALIRSLNLKLLNLGSHDEWLPAIRERLAAHPSAALDLLRQN